MPKTRSTIASLRDDVRRLARPRLKVAALGGEQDMPFEQAFSNLAHAYLKDKAPSLLDYEVGFQLVDRNQENTKAIGVFGFKVGSQWLYAPVFFLNGDLKGHELLYIKNQDMFVPMKENWLNYILNKKPNILGSEVGRNLHEIGVAPPHLYQLSRSPHKFASALKKMSGWALEAMPTLAHLATTNPAHEPKFKDLPDLPSFLKKEGRAVVKSLILGFQANPKLAKAFDQFHGLQTIDEAIAEIQAQEKTAASTSILKESKCVNTARGVRCFKPPVKAQPKSVLQEPQSIDNAGSDDTLKTADVGDPLDSAVQYAQQKKLKIVIYDEVLQHGTSLENLDDKDREKLISDKVLIKDERPDATKAYEVTSTVRLQNPAETGLYDVLTRHNKFEKCLIIFGPYNTKGRKDFVTLVRVDGGDDKGRAWLNIHPSHIWVGHQYTNEEYQNWWKKLPEVNDLPVSRRGLHVLIGNTGEGSLPFTVDKEVSTGDRKIYDVWFKSWAEKSRADHLPPISTRLMHYRGDYGVDDGCRIQLTGKRGARLRATSGDLYVPSDYRRLTLRPAGDDDDDDGVMGICGCDAHSDPSPIEPGNQLDIDLLLGTKTAAVKMFVSGSEFVINNQRMQKLAALIHLVRDWGFREKTARLLMKRAEKIGGFRFRVKKATQTYDMQQNGPTAPGIPETPVGYDPMTGGNVPTQNVGEWNVKVPEMSAANTDRSIYHPLGPDPDYQQGPDRGAQQTAMQAAQSGQKEIFDTAMIGSLLKAVRDDSMVDRYMGDLMKGLDRLGRILFLFYWHGEKFQERYGKGDMVELEDGIRNAFEYLGDLVLFLKQRSVDTPDDQMGVNLSDISGE
jgi:hypothetical protein